MIGRVKKWLGIEGVKLNVQVEEPIRRGDPYLRGHIVFHSMQRGCIQSVYLNVKEIYTRGRGKKRRTDEFMMGEIEMEGPIDIPEREEISKSFEVSLDWYTSEMDEFEGKNVVSGQVARIAKWVKGVHSEYILTAEAHVEGTKLHPFDQVELNVK